MSAPTLERPPVRWVASSVPQPCHGCGRLIFGIHKDARVIDLDFCEPCSRTYFEGC